MKTPAMKWRAARVRMQGGEELMIGKVQVGAAFYDALRPRDTPVRYVVQIRLPGIKPADANKYKPTMEEAKAMVEKLVETWFGWLSKQQEG